MSIFQIFKQHDIIKESSFHIDHCCVMIVCEENLMDFSNDKLIMDQWACNIKFNTFGASVADNWHGSFNIWKFMFQCHKYLIYKNKF